MNKGPATGDMRREDMRRPAIAEASSKTAELNRMRIDGFTDTLRLSTTGTASRS
jgi:hypothetical protein